MDRGEGCSNSNKLVYWSFNQERSRIDFVKMIISDELSFRFIEGKRFHHFMSVTKPEFKLASRNTVVEECFSIYMQEMKELEDVLTSLVKGFALALIGGVLCKTSI